jgi:hypothetical protein
MVAGCKSNEERALTLIDKEMFNTLLDYESYEPIETMMEEAVASAYTDSLARKYVIAYEALDSLFEKEYEQATDDLDYLRIYAGSYSYSGRSKFKEYQDKAVQHDKELKRYQGLLVSYADSTKTRLSKFTSPSFSPEHIGWEVSHKFRCKTRGGNFEIANYIFIMDDRFSKIIAQYNMDDEDEKKIRNRIAVEMKADATPSDEPDGVGLSE